MITLSPLTQKRWHHFRSNKRGFVSLLIFIALFFFSLCAEFIANDVPLVVQYKGHYYFPIFKSYPETVFGGDFETTTNYKDVHVQELIAAKGWMLMAPIPYSYDTVNYHLPSPAPSAPTRENILYHFQ